MASWLKQCQIWKLNSPDFNLSLAGTGGSNLPDLKAEFTDIAHTRGVILRLDLQS